MRLDMAVDLIPIRGGRQDEGQHLDEIALRDIALGDLPVEDEDIGSKADIALIEVVMCQGGGKLVLHRMPARQAVDQTVASAPDLVADDGRKSRMRIVEQATPQRAVR